MNFKKYKIVIIGPGALGCLFAARLAALDGPQVWILDRSRERADFLNRRGIKVIENDSPAGNLRLNATAGAKSIGSADLILLCVKSYDVETALVKSLPLCKSDTLLIALQNGILHLPRLISTKNPGYRAAGVTAMGATLVSTGEIKFGGSGTTQIGFLEPQDNHADKLLKNAAYILTSAAIATSIETDIRQNIWAKLMTNIGINALTVIYDCPNGGLLENPGAKQMLAQAVLEAQKVAQALGMNFGHDPVAKTYAVCRATAQNISSMLQDIRHNRPTEIEAINGAVLQEARRLGIAAPVNKELVQRVRAMEKAPKCLFP